MASIKFLIKGKKNPASVYVRLRNGRQTDLTIATGFLIDPKHWSDVKGEVKQNSLYDDKLIFNTNLRELKDDIIKQINNAVSSEVEISKEWLETAVSNYNNPVSEEKTETIVQLIKEYQNELKNKINPKTNKQISESSIRGYNQVISRVESFEKHSDKTFLITDIDLTFKFDFVAYMKNKLGHSQNTINKTIKQLKSVCIDAMDRGYSVNSQIRSTKFNHPKEEVDFVTITEAEINEIRKFKGTNYHMNARDWLIIGCWTGCRVNDLMQLTMNNINETEKGQKFIRYTQSKTNKQVDIPIHQHVEEILKRLKGFPRPISDQRFNEWIKDVCRDSGLTQEVYGSRQNPKSHKKEVGSFKKYELIRSHTCRRSFATNHYNKLPNKIIMAVTGHSTESMLLNYIGETKNDHIDDFLNVWNK
jgi:integrase